jgi:uncharacterized membrane protein HdeD (DUF308 family)
MQQNMWLVAGLVSIALGYVLLGWMESMVLAPILLVAGYCVLLPAHLWIAHRRGSVGE